MLFWIGIVLALVVFVANIVTESIKKKKGGKKDDGSINGDN